MEELIVKCAWCGKPCKPVAWKEEADEELNVIPQWICKDCYEYVTGNKIVKERLSSK